jgi:outer membrane protein
MFKKLIIKLKKMIEKLTKNLWIITSVLAVAVIVLFVMQFMRKGDIAFIETSVLLQKYEGMKVAQAEYDKKAALWKANSDTLVKGWEAELKTYEKERSHMSAKERELKEELLRNKQQQISNYRDAIDKKAKDEEQKMMQTVFNEVNDYVAGYGKRHGYKYILGANGSGNIIYANKSLNITDEIVEALNKEYKGKK